MTPSELTSFGAVVVLLSAAFGALAIDLGLSAPDTMLMSVLVVTGASQLVMISTLADGGSLLAGLTAGWLVATRFTVLGVAVSPRIRLGPVQRLLAAHVLIDGSAAAALRSRDPEVATRAYWAAGLTVFIGWNVGTLLGVVIGRVVPDPSRWGLDAALPAVLLALIANELRQRRMRQVAIVAALAATGLVYVVGTELAVLLGAFLAWVIGLAWNRSR